MHEADIKQAFEELLTPRHREIILQGATKIHGIELGGRLMRKIRVERDNPLAKALLIHKLTELTLYKHLGLDLVHHSDDHLDCLNQASERPEPHKAARAVHCRYLLACAREHGITASLTQVLDTDPLSAQNSPAAHTHDNPALRAYLSSLKDNAYLLSSEPFLIPPRQTPLTAEAAHAATDHAALVPVYTEKPEGIINLCAAITQTWADSQYGTSIYVHKGKVTVNHGDARPNQTGMLEDLLKPNGVRIERLAHD